MFNYTDYDALGLAELVRKKEVTPIELLETAIKNVETVNPQLNAVITEMFDEGRKAASGNIPDGPFAGVPFLIKDLVSTYAGARFTKGCKGLESYIAPRDSEVMKRYKQSGMVIFGKTNTPEFGLLGVTEPDAHGPTSTPWDITRNSGGSSGGSGSAVGAGMVPIASGGDGGGSLRIPASCCGVFGFKPSRGRVSTEPEGELWQGAAVEGVITRSVRDSAAMLDVLRGAVAGEAYHIESPEEAYLQALQKDPRQLKIAFTTNSPLDAPVDDACIAAVHNAAKLLESLGHIAEEAQPKYDGLALAMSYLMMYFGEVAAEIRNLEPMMGRKARQSDVELLTWTFGMLGRTITAGDFVAAKHRWNDFARTMGTFHQTYDLYLTPTIAILPPKIGELMPNKLEQISLKTMNTLRLGRLLKASGMIEQMAKDALAAMPFTQLANLTGQPAMSVPLYWTQDELPCGVQFIAPFGDEATLFQLAAQLEKARPWFDRNPPVFAGRAS